MQQRSAAVQCALAALLFGVSTPAAAALASRTAPLALAGLLYLGAALAVLPWFVTAPPSRDALARSAPLLALAIGAGGAVGPALLTAGLVDTPAATASLLLNLELVATVLLAATFFREHLGPSTILAALLVSGAGALLVWEPGVGVSAGSLLIVGACCCWGLDNSVTSRIDQIAPHHVTFFKGIVAGTANLALGAAFAEGDAVGSIWTLLGALAIGAVGYGLSTTLWVRGAQQLGAARAQVIFASAPFIGAAVAWMTSDGAPTGRQLGAAAIAAAGVGLSMRSAHSHEHRHSELDHSHEHAHDDGHHDHDHEHAELVVGSHSHRHVHRPIAHSHPHVPDLHHRHDHE
jgi:drug/metabolite transporter (DMT)-like permease